MGTHETLGNVEAIYMLLSFAPTVKAAYTCMHVRLGGSSWSRHLLGLISARKMALFPFCGTSIPFCFVAFILDRYIPWFRMVFFVVVSDYQTEMQRTIQGLGHAYSAENFPGVSISP